MRISPEDRSLARELAELLDLDEQVTKMLGVVLSSHRQLPSDGPPSFPDPRGVLCAVQSEPSIFPGAGEIPVNIPCSLRAGHKEPRHGGYGPGGAWCTWPVEHCSKLSDPSGWG